MSAFADIVRQTDAEPPAWDARLGEHLSATRLTMFLRCPEQYRRVYVQGERQRPGGALIWGSADHGAHEQNFRQKIDSGEDMPVGDLEVAFVEQFDQAVNRNGGPGEIDWGNDKPGEMKDRGVALAAVYHRQVSPRVRPVAVEERFLVDVPGVPVPVLGFVDVRADVDGAVRLIERKTSARRVSELKPEWRLQGLLYQSVEALPVDWHLSVKTKTPAVYTPAEEAGLSLASSGVAIGVAQRMVRNTARQLASTFQTFGPDEPWPGSVTYGWACGFCGFRDTCPWWAYEREAA